MYKAGWISWMCGNEVKWMNVPLFAAPWHWFNKRINRYGSGGSEGRTFQPLLRYKIKHTEISLHIWTTIAVTLTSLNNVYYVNSFVAYQNWTARPKFRSQPRYSIYCCYFQFPAESLKMFLRH